MKDDADAEGCDTMALALSNPEARWSPTARASARSATGRPAAAWLFPSASIRGGAAWCAWPRRRSAQRNGCVSGEAFEGGCPLGIYLAPAEGGEMACSYQWHERSDGYAGVMDDPSDCPAEFPVELHVTPGHLVATYANDAGEVVHRARRVTAKPAGSPSTGRHIDPDAADDDFILMRDIALHDEGFVVSIADAGKPTGYAVELARLTYQNTRTAVLKLGVVDESSGETVSYSWTEPGTERIGINLRWVQPGLTRSR